MPMAAIYDDDAEMFDPEAVDPVVEFHTRRFPIAQH